jgi:putative transposase
MGAIQIGLQTTRNVVDQTASHAVGIPKYRKRVRADAVAGRRRGLIREVAQATGVAVLAWEIPPDHVHLCFSAPPAIAPSLAVPWFKGSTARRLFAESPPWRRVFPRGPRGAPSFDVGPAGQVSAATIRRSIERAEHVRTRR